jgi:PAS domain S-box-containing protein
VPRLGSNHPLRKLLAISELVGESETAASATRSAAAPLVRPAGNVRKKKSHAAEEILQKIFDNIPVMVNFFDQDGRLILVNRQWENILGWTLEEIAELRIDPFVECFPDPERRQEVFEWIAAARGDWGDFRIRVRSGETIETTWCTVRLSDGTAFGIGTDITDRKRMEQELRASREQLRAWAAYLDKVREEERTRIARELHDDLGQNLTGLRLGLSWLAGRLARSTRAGDEPLLERTRSMIQLVDGTVESVRRTATALRPRILDDLGLAAAMEWQAADFQKNTNIRCELATSLGSSAPAPDIATAVFRIVQEALTNVARHARARHVRIALSQDDGHLLVEVTDDGIGITSAERSHPGSLGLLGMKERARLLGGELVVQSANGRGTTVSARVPVGI